MSSREAQADESELGERLTMPRLTADTPAGPDGGPAGLPASKPTRSLRPPGVHDLEELLEDRLNTRVKVDMGGKRGKLVIEFATLDDLERIYRGNRGRDLYLRSTVALRQAYYTR